MSRIFPKMSGNRRKSICLANASFRQLKLENVGKSNYEEIVNLKTICHFISHMNLMRVSERKVKSPNSQNGKLQTTNLSQNAKF